MPDKNTRVYEISPPTHFSKEYARNSDSQQQPMLSTGLQKGFTFYDAG